MQSLTRAAYLIILLLVNRTACQCIHD